MTQRHSQQTTNSNSASVSSLIMFPVWLGLTIVLGLWEVGWSLSDLPIWFYGYAVLAALVSLLAVKVAQRDSPDHPFFQRVLLRGVGWGGPLVAMLFGRPLLGWADINPSLLTLFFGLWIVISVIYGLISLRSEQTKLRPQSVSPRP